MAAGLLIKKVNPKYPEEARAQRIQGVVVPRAVISKEGRLVDLEVVTGDSLLTAAAIKAVKKWEYKPYLLQERPVEVETQIQVNFTLSGG